VALLAVVICVIDKIKKVVERENKFLVFNSNGRLVELSNEEYSIFKKFGELKEFPTKINEQEKEVLELLCDLELIEYTNYATKKIKKQYSSKLYDANSINPVGDAPFLAHLAVTTNCNMHCKYCSVRNAHQKINTKELSTEQWKTIIKKLSDAGVFQIGFTGGEPTLRKDIHELMRFTESVGCVCNLTTNCWDLNEQFIDEMVKTGIRQCQVSLDSFNDEIHDKLRGQGSLKRVVKSIELLQKKGIHVGIDCVISTNNIKDILNMIKKCEELQIQYVTLIKLKKGDLDEVTFKSLVPSYTDYGQLIDSLCYRKNEMPNVTIDCASISNLQYTLKDSELKSIPTAGCPVGHNLVCIAPNGDIYPCAALLTEKFKLGNILTDDFKDLWKKNKLLQSLRNIKNLVEGKCSSCSRLDFCRAGCRGIAYTLNNKSFYVSDDSCEYKKVEV